MPDLLWLLSALAPLALWVAVRAHRRQRDLDARVRDLEHANIAAARVERLAERMHADFVAAAPRIHLPSPAAEAKVAYLTSVGFSEHDARNLAQVDALDEVEPAVGDEPPTEPTHSRPSDMAAFRKA
jgi:hypothetical protein